MGLTLVVSKTSFLPAPKRGSVLQHVEDTMEGKSPCLLHLQFKYEFPLAMRAPLHSSRKANEKAHSQSRCKRDHLRTLLNGGGYRHLSAPPPPILLTASSRDSLPFLHPLWHPAPHRHMPKQLEADSPHTEFFPLFLPPSTALPP